MPVQKERSRLWNVLLYPDNADHVAALEVIRSSFQYVGICHDKDTNEDGELLKPHYHLILKFPQARWNSALADDLCIPINFFQRTRSFDNSGDYLLHENSPEKYQYDPDALEGPLAPLVLKRLASDDENLRALTLISLLDSTYSYISLREFMRLVCEKGLYSDMRRMGALVLRMLDEHNAQFHSYPIGGDIAEKERP